MKTKLTIVLSIFVLLLSGCINFDAIQTENEKQISDDPVITKF